MYNIKLLWFSMKYEKLPQQHKYWRDRRMVQIKDMMCKVISSLNMYDYNAIFEFADNMDLAKVSSRLGVGVSVSLEVISNKSHVDFHCFIVNIADIVFFLPLLIFISQTFIFRNVLCLIPSCSKIYTQLITKELV